MQERTTVFWGTHGLFTLVQKLLVRESFGVLNDAWCALYGGYNVA